MSAAFALGCLAGVLATGVVFSIFWLLSRPQPPVS